MRCERSSAMVAATARHPPAMMKAWQAAKRVALTERYRSRPWR
jgi:hypothetical protein